MAFRLVPVIDLKDGVVVQAIAGQRASYQPVRSQLCPSAAPGEIARALRQKLQADRVYVADLNALAGGEPDWAAIQAIGESGLKLWLDLGCHSARAFHALAANVDLRPYLDGIIVALETLRQEQDLLAFGQVELESAIFSLDQRQGQLMTQVPAWRSLGPEQLASLAYRVGFRRIITLDLAYVGTAQGIQHACDRVRQLRQADPWQQVVSGGGLRDERDAERLADADCDAILVATAIHQGRITRLSRPVVS